MRARNHAFALIAAAATCVAMPQLAIPQIHDPFRQMMRDDPLVSAVLEALTVKNQGCPVQEITTTPDPMRVMKEVEPFFGSDPTAAMLEVRLNCSDGVAATVNSYYDDQRGGWQSLTQRLRGIDFSYGDFVDRYLVRWPQTTTTIRDQVLNDPVVVKVYPVLARRHKKCEDVTSGKLSVGDTPSYAESAGKVLKYLPFALTLTCRAEGSGTTYSFVGKYFIASGYVTWDRVAVGGWQ
jgi:hypothetical protein